MYLIDRTRIHCANKYKIKLTRRRRRCARQGRFGIDGRWCHNILRKGVDYIRLLWLLTFRKVAGLIRLLWIVTCWPISMQPTSSSLEFEATSPWPPSLSRHRDCPNFSHTSLNVFSILSARPVKTRKAESSSSEAIVKCGGRREANNTINNM